MDQEQIKNKEILVNEVIAKLSYFTKLYGIDTLFVVGGYCRSSYLGRIWEVNDIDVASAFEEQSMEMCGLFASEVLKTTPVFYKRSGAGSVMYNSELGQIKIEFQGRSPHEYMNNKDVRDWMHEQHIEDVPLMHNLYGRDFTINSLIFSLNQQKMYDPISLGAADMEKKIVRSILPSNLLVKYNPLSILRAIRFSLEYEFHIEESLRHAMKEGVNLLSKTLTEERIIQEIVRILKTNSVEGLEMLRNYGLDRFLLNPEFKSLLSLEATNEED